MDPRLRTPLAVAAIAGQLLFVGGVLVLGVIEHGGYSAGRHDVSDFGALTAQHATLYRLTAGISGLLTIAFALSLLAVLGRTAWLVALSLPGLDNLTDAFFRLDCRAADRGCDLAAATASWHGTAHVVSFVIAALATVAAPFALARRMRRSGGWEDLARPTRIYGAVIVAALLATGASSGTAAQGWSQRVAIVIVTAAVAALAWRVVRLDSRGAPAADLSPAVSPRR
jgi:hypothetical protein